MLPEFSDTQARIIGCLMEKSVVTPDQYPLTLSALTNACNQKSARTPVMSLQQGEVQRAARELRDDSLVQIEENFRNNTEKYNQRLCNTTFNDFQFDSGQFAIVCLLLLRGPQTPGELRAHSGRLHSFADNAEVVAALTGLLEWTPDPLVIKLPRTPGRKDAEYMHLFAGPIDVDALAGQTASAKSKPMSNNGDTGNRNSIAALSERLSALESEVAALKSRLESPD